MSTDVYNVMALESDQKELLDEELFQAGSESDTVEGQNIDLIQIEEENAGEENSFTVREADDALESGGDNLGDDTANADLESSDLEINDEEDSDEEINAVKSAYMLYITHTLLYKKDGKEMHLQEFSQVQLTQEDFAENSYNLMEQAYDWEAVSVSMGQGCMEQISIEDFWEYEEGRKEYYAEICYTVKDGWEVRFCQEEGTSGSMFYSIYEGAFDNIEFVPAKSITLTIYYKYSNTGGLAGIDAHAPDEIVLPLKEDGTADLEHWRVPHCEGGNNLNLEGFRIVLDPSPLNEFLVNPDTAENPSAYPDALENGDFNLRPDVDTNSPEYQAAWDAARTKTVRGITFTYIAPTVNGGTNATTSDDLNEQYTLNASGLTEDLTLTIYYRRSMGTYTVNYWKRAAWDDGSDELIETMKKSGRVGALTNVQPLEEAPKGYLLEGIAQKTIAADASTTVDVYYSTSQIRVIFNTDYIYIPRQQVGVGGNVDFSRIDQAKMDAARDGYRFCGWQYENVSGKLVDVQMTDNKLQLTSEFLAQANIAGSQETDNTSIRVLNLYPKWEDDITTVRIIFWIEDLNGDDVKVTDSYYNFNGSNEVCRVREGYERIQHQDYKSSSASYTNAGSFIVNNVATNEALIGKNGKLIEDIQDEINRQLSLMGTMTISGSDGSQTVANSHFYEQQGVTVLGAGEDGFSAAADGSTQVNVFFARKEYTLDFIYYFLPVQNGTEDIAICTETEAFQTYIWPTGNNDYPDASGANVTWEKISADGEGRIRDVRNREVPRRTVITAKYGADLRSVWPGAENVGTGDGNNDTRYILGNKMRISWTTTVGIHNAVKCGGNKNVPGAYSTMNAAIVADIDDNSIIHHLVAYWNGIVNNTYRYNYCYEVPELEPAKVREGDFVTILRGTENAGYVGLSEEERKDRNTMYLVPATEQAFMKYGFSDLLTYGELALTGKDEKKPADYYVVRIQNNKCYAVSRQLVAISSRPISEQNPSARPNLKLENGVFRDHSTQLPDGEGVGNAGYNSPNNPYDIYFYYARDEFTITYISNKTIEIGKISLPYGARLYESRYNIPLDYTKKSGYYTVERDGYAAWSTGNNISSVCPERREDEARAWVFAGWTLSPFGDRPMEWENGSDPIVIEGNLLLYAKWEAPSYTVEFDWNGGRIPDSVVGSDEEQIKSQKIPANQSFVKHGQIPHPIREGYILQGWQITHKGQANGNDIEWIPASGADGSFPEFYFDVLITSDLKVQAVWTPSGRAEISYTVYYLEKETKKTVAEPKTVTGIYRVGTVVWERPAVPKNGPYQNYVPLEQNKSVTLDTTNENRLVFYYEAPSNYSYQVKFVEYGTNVEILHYTRSTKSVSLLVYTEKAQVDELEKLGYWVVDDDGNPQENGASLGKTIYPGVQEKPEAIFYVLPREYEIYYTNLGVMGEAAERELRKLNPTSYVSQDPDLPKTLKNPEDSYLFNGQEYTFWAGIWNGQRKSGQ